MDQTKKTPLASDKPKILYTLSTLQKDPSLALLNEYRAKGSESLRPSKKPAEMKKRTPFRNENSERKNRNRDKSEGIQGSKAITFKVPAHSLSPSKPSRNPFPRQLEKIEEHLNVNHHTNPTPLHNNNTALKTDFFLKGTMKPRLSKPTIVETKPVKEKNKEACPETYKYAVGAGNNGRLVKRIMQQRGDYWEEVPTTAQTFNFKWLQNNKTYNYEKLTLSSSVKQVVNHFEFHKEVSSKAGLVKNLAFYCEQNKMNLFDITPITFILDMNKEDFEQTLSNFISFYHRNMPTEMQKPENQRKVFLDIPRRTKHFYHSYEKRMNLFGMYGRPKMTRTYINGSHYLWLLKPNYFNRGRGIQIFQSLEEMERMIVELCEGVEENVFFHIEKEEKENEKALEKAAGPNEKNPAEKPNNNTDKNKKGTIKLNTFVIQKYIERPLLIESRKFDIRVWVLVSHNYDVYFFREGYLRTSSEPFMLDHNSINNHYIHLTNNAIQKNGKNYGCFEAGNQLSFQTFEKYLAENKINLDLRAAVIPKIKENILISLNAAKRRFNQDDRKYCFEIFGYDFIIDEDFHVWLIEVNTNPCIEESSPLLHMLIPRMLNDAFKLTLDVVFPMNPKFKPNPSSFSQGQPGVPSVNALRQVPSAFNLPQENPSSSAINEKDPKGSNEETKESPKEIVPTIEDIAEKEEEGADENGKGKTNEQDYTFEVKGYSKDENLCRFFKGNYWEISR